MLFPLLPVLVAGKTSIVSHSSTTADMPSLGSRLASNSP